MHFHGVEYKPSSDGAFLPGFSGTRRRRQARPDLDLQADRRPRLRGRLAVPRPRPVMEESIDGGMFGMLSILGARERAARPRVRRDLLPDGRVPGDRRPRVRRQHAGLPVQRRRARAVGRDGDGLRAPHLPRPRPPLARPGGVPRRHRQPSARPSRSASAGARRTPAPGSTTATWRPTWRRA